MYSILIEHTPILYWFSSLGLQTTSIVEIQVLLPSLYRYEWLLPWTITAPCQHKTAVNRSHFPVATGIRFTTSIRSKTVRAKLLCAWFILLPSANNSIHWIITLVHVVGACTVLLFPTRWVRNVSQSYGIICEVNNWASIFHFIHYALIFDFINYSIRQ